MFVVTSLVALGDVSNHDIMCPSREGPVARLDLEKVLESSWKVLKTRSQKNSQLLEAPYGSTYSTLQSTTANITIDHTLRKLCEFGFSEALRMTKVCPSTYFNVWFLCMALVSKVLAKC